MNKTILASNSPRRKELLQKAGIEFIIDASSIEERMDETLPLEKKLQQLAIDKATPIHKKYPNDIVIGADTIVYFQNQIIGKAKDEKEARKILNALSNRRHCVYTSVAIYFQDELITFIDQTDVYFKDITDMIDKYIASKEWIGKAGAYGIQGSADCFVDHVDGDIDNVIGLPLYKVISLFKEKGILHQ